MMSVSTGVLVDSSRSLSCSWSATYNAGPADAPGPSGVASSFVRRRARSNAPFSSVLSTTIKPSDRDSRVASCCIDTAAPMISVGEARKTAPTVRIRRIALASIGRGEFMAVSRDHQSKRRNVSRFFVQRQLETVGQQRLEHPHRVFGFRIGRHFGFDVVSFSTKPTRLSRDLKLLDVISSAQDRKSTRLNSSHLGISYAVFC